MKNDRIEIPVHYDLWMRGARFGKIVSILDNGTWLVKSDHSKVPFIRIPVADQSYCNII